MSPNGPVPASTGGSATIHSIVEDLKNPLWLADGPKRHLTKVENLYALSNYSKDPRNPHLIPGAPVL